MYKKLLALIAASCGALAIAATSATATPTGEFEVFAQCPTSNPLVEGCVYALTESGEFVMGNETVPITKTITLQGGIYENEETNEKFFVGASNGETLSKTPQNVPGGLAGLINCTEISFYIARVACEATLEKGLTGVTATAEIAGPASGIEVNTGHVITEIGVAVKLPIKVHLENAFLGSACYIGSNSEPIMLNLTTGTTSPPPPNEPIKGAAGEQEENAEGTILTLKHNELVDNAFAAPGVNGCGGILSSLIDPLIDLKTGLPSAAGHNTAILKGTLKSTNATAVVAHS